jgi:long-chain acyl-CoA synthetase
MTRVDDNEFGSVGKAVPGVETNISNPNSEGIGEIIVKGPNVMKGYYKNPGATADVIRDGWFHTGDLGRFDKNGNLFITGRCKDVIVLGSGINVYPDEVEFTISKSPYIKEMCVFGGLIKSGARKGMEEVRAVVVPDLEKIRTDKNIGVEEDIRSFIGGELAGRGSQLTDYKRVAKFYISKEELPKTATRKVKRFAVKERYK